MLKYDIDTNIDAYWLSPNGDIIQVPSHHIDIVRENIDVFNLTQEYIDGVIEKYGVQELRDGGKGRNKIMLKLIDSGWTRIRYNARKNEEFWNIQIQNHSFNYSNIIDNLYKWADKMIINNHYSKNDSVIISDTRHNIIFGNILYTKQKFIKDLLII